MRRPPAHRRPRDPFARAVLGVRKEPILTCPNEPQCRHPGMIHDAPSYDAPLVCSVDDCPCGKDQTEEGK